MNYNNDTGLIEGLLTIDTTVAPPLGGLVNSLYVVGSGSLVLPSGAVVDRPASPIAAMFRYNSDVNLLEFFDGVVWNQLSTSSGTVSSVTLTTTTGMTVSGGVTQTISNTGSFDLVLSNDLQALSALAGTGIVVRTGAATYAERTLTSADATIVITNGDGVAAAPNLDLALVGTPVTDAFVHVTTDVYGRVTATSAVTTADITALVDATYVNVTGDTMSGNLTMTGGSEVLGLPTTPSGDTAATSKAYVDSVAAGLSWKTSVKAGSTADIDLTTGGLLIVDGYQTVDGDRVLVKDQADLTQNGIYIAAAGTWVRASDMDQTTPTNEINGAAVYVELGTVNKTTGWTQIDQVTAVGTDPIEWTQFSGTGSYTAGNGLTLTGTVFSLTTPVSTANGGTGLSATGTADQFLTVNGAGTALEYKTITGSTGLTVTPSAGGLALVNTGVTSVAGTANQITASAATGAVTLSIPNDFQVPGTESVVGSLTLNPALAVGNIGVNLIIYGNTANDLQDWILNDGSTVAAKVDPAGNLYLYKGLGDSANSLGTNGQVLSSTGGGVLWIDAQTPVSSLSFGTTGLTPATATTGDIVVDGVLNVAHGGTGLTALGTANQVLGVNAAGTDAEYKTVAAGTGISVVHTAGTITVNNTGVTSVGLTAPSIFTVTGSPVTTTGVLDFSLNTQVANTVFSGPAAGADAVPTFRALSYADLPLKLYVENPSTPVAPAATGANAVAIGSGSVATADGGFAVGDGADARVTGMKAFANGSFAAPGDAQHGVYVVRNTTTDATTTPLFIDGAATQLIVPDNSVMTFSVMVAGRRTDAVGGGAGYKFEGAVRKDTTAGSVTFIGTPSKTLLGETNVPWDATLTVDTTTGAIVVSGKGEAAKTVRWVATFLTTEVTN